jgi:hypothetical protein
MAHLFSTECIENLLTRISCVGAEIDDKISNLDSGSVNKPRDAQNHFISRRCESIKSSSAPLPIVRVPSLQLIILHSVAF